MTGNDIYYYLSPLHLSLPRKPTPQPRPGAHGRFFLTIWDPEAVDPRYTGGKGSGLAKLCRAIADLKEMGLPVDVPFAVVFGPNFARRLLLTDPGLLDLVKELEAALARGEEVNDLLAKIRQRIMSCLLYTSPSPRDRG